MNIKERLKCYEKALKHYKKSNSKIFGWFYKSLYRTNLGFCSYFLDIQHLDLYYSFEDRLPELYKQRGYYMVTNYWFKPGNIKSRIKCLEEAIKLCEVN